MSKRMPWIGWLAVVMVAGATVPAWSDTPNTDDETVAELEAILQAQQKRLDQLQQQVAATAMQNQDAQRMAAMKDQIREVLSEREFRESLVTSTLQAGYDDGFFIRSSDEKFLISFFGRVQFRWTHYGTRSNNRYMAPGFRRHDRTGFDAERLRFGFIGHAFDPDLTYYIELEADAADGYNFVWSEGNVGYRFCDEFQFAAGMLKYASTRASLTSDANMQFVERPMFDAVFGLGYGIGVRFWGQVFDQQLDWYLDVANGITDGEGVAGGRTITNDEDRELDNNPAIIFKTVWHALHGDDGVDMGTHADHTITQTPALDLGFHYAFNEDRYDVMTSRIPYPRQTFFRKGGFGLTNSNGLQVHQFGFEGHMKWMGFSTTAEYVIRLLDVRSADHPRFTPLYLATGDDSTTAQHGAYMQCGYFLPIPGMERKLEAVARVGGISALSSDQEGSWEYSGGLNYYFEEDGVKLQTDVTKIQEVPITNSRYSLANVNDDALIWRVQLQVSF